MFLTCFKVTATASAQKVNLTLKDVSLETAFTEIKRQTGLSFWYDKAELEKASKISVSIKNATTQEVLEECLKGSPFTFEIFDKTVVIKLKTKPNSSPENRKVIDFTIKGKVIDEQGSPMSGVTVKLRNTDRITQTNGNGEFSIEVANDNSVLQFSFLGYTTTERTVNGGKFLEIILIQETNTLKGIEINAGYYTVKDRERTGSISKLTAETIEKQPVLNSLQAMQNRVPGMQITQNTGLAGGSFNVQIRGRSSINNSIGNKPLYIIDNVIYPSTYIGNGNSQASLLNGGIDPLSTINPADIESIEVLKDADATAIYGSRGANGVILIKTKNGKSGDRRFNVSFMQGVSQVGKKLDLLNTKEYVEMRNEALKNDGLTAGPTDYDVNGIYDIDKYTDWQKKLIGGTANTSNMSFSVGGGTENTNYLLGANYYREGTVFPGDFNFNRFGLRSSLNLGSPNDRLSLNFTGSYNFTKNRLTRTDPTANILLAPNAPDVYDENGELNWANNTVIVNPMADLLRKNDISINNMIMNVILNYKIYNSLSFKTSAGYNLLKTQDYLKTPLSSLAPANNPTSLSRRASFSDSSISAWSIEPQLSYNEKLGPGNLSAIVGLSFQESLSQLRGLEATNFSSDGLMDNVLSASSITPTSSENNQYRYTAVFARFNYSLKNKYYINLTARRDGSTRYGPDKQFANFGAVGVAWIFSEENFIKDKLPILDFAKIRASYGITGNDQIGDYKYLSLWRSLGTYQGVTTLAPSLGNADYGWETNKKLEIALQLKMFQSKFGLEISYYNNRSGNQLIGDQLPLSTGNSSVIANRPASVQNSGLELLADLSLLKNRNWQWLASLNLTIPRNKLLSYPGIENSSDAFNYVVGKPLNILWSYGINGVNNQTGLYDIVDYDANGLINPNDRYLQKFTGQYFYGGISNSVSYKKLSLDIFISVTKQNGYNYLYSSNTLPGRWSANVYPNSNQPSYVLDRWQKIGDNSTIQKFSTTASSATVYNNARNNGLSIEDASFARLKNISLSYSLPSDLLSKVKIYNAMISLSGQNLFTITKYKGLDPETQSLTRLPPLRTFMLGINLTL